jgi:hypothetical protein
MVKHVYGSCHVIIYLLFLHLTGRTIKKPHKASVTAVKFSPDFRKASPKCDNARYQLFSRQMTNFLTFRNFLTGIFTVIRGWFKKYPDWNYSGCSLVGMCLQPVLTCSYMS